MGLFEFMLGGIEKDLKRELANFTPIVKFLKHDADEINAFFIDYGSKKSE